jgi:hypothetical protein
MSTDNAIRALPNHGEAYVVQHDMHVLAQHRDVLGHLSVDQGFEVAAVEHYTQRLGFDDPIPSALLASVPIRRSSSAC